MVQKFIKAFSDKAQRSGIQRLDFFVLERIEKTINVYQQETERVSLAEEALVFIEGEYNGKRGCTFVEDLSHTLFDEHIDNIQQTAEYNSIAFKPRSLSNIAESKGAMIKAHEFHDFADILKNAEMKARDHDQQISNVSVCSCTETVQKITLLNSSGDRMEDITNRFHGRIQVVAGDGDSVQSAGDNLYSSSIAELDFLGLAERTAANAVSMLGAKPVKTGLYEVVLKNTVVCDLILAFLPGLYADKVQRNMSVLQNKLGQKIASPLFSLTEDPNLPGGLITRRFDDEGTPTFEKSLIKEGVLDTYLHNLETASIAGVASTGNGFRQLYKEPPRISATNLCLQGGECALEELQNKMQEGLVIHDCDGIFAGANPVSGDFSLIARGFLMNNGMVNQAVNQITIAGNYYDMISQILHVGNDFAVSVSNNGFVKAPSLHIAKLSVSGT